MKKQLLTKVLLFTTLSLFSLVTRAQDVSVNVKQKIVDQNGKPSFIEFSQNSIYNSSDDQKIFKEQLGLDNNSSFSKVKTEADNSGYVHEKFQLSYKGVKVEFATYSLHSKNGKLSSMSGEYYDIEEVSTTPTISKETAFQNAINHIGASTYLWDDVESAATIGYGKPTAELVLLPSMADQGKKVDQQKVNLAYKFDIYATSPVSRGDLYIDAITGSILYYNATIKHLGKYSHGNKNSLKSINDTKGIIPFFASPPITGTAATRYSGSQNIQTVDVVNVGYMLQDQTRGKGVQTYNMERRTDYATAVDFVDADNNWSDAEFNNTNKDNGGLDAHWGAEKTYDYFSAIHQRNSFDNAGAAIKSYVHFDNAFNNAYWNGSVMTYGDGDGQLFDVLTSLDVAAHEIGHAICSNTANLAYQKESGAMNEAFSDIWGACVEYYAAPSKSTWLIGEDIMKNGAAALRSMSDPKAQGQPDTYGGTNWQTIDCGIPDSEDNDYCGVHTNSGVLNHWFYILSIGKNGTNDINSQYNVTGISIDKAAKIAYRLESVYLTANSTYANARTYGIQAAIDLYGLRSAEHIATTDAFYAVGVGAKYVDDNTAPSTPANLTAAGTTGGSTNLSWDASTDNVGVSGYNVYNGQTLLATATGTSYMVTGLTHRTTYSFTVKAKDDSQNLSGASAPISVTTGNYCHSQGNQSDLLNIAKVELGTINNSSTTTNGYSDFTALTTNLTKGVADTITITRFGNYSLGYSVYIDLNGDNDFEDDGELVWSKAPSKTAPVLGSFTVPSSAKTGATRMRVSMGYEFSPTSCRNKNFSGEVEDYTVNIVAEGTVLVAPTSLEASGTTSSSTVLNWTASEDAAVTAYNVYQFSTTTQNGIVINEPGYLGTTTSTTYPVTGLTSSTEYSFTVKAKDEAGNLSEATNEVTVTTKVLSPPTALAAAETTSSSTVLNWTAPADSMDVVGYNVYNGDELEHEITSTETNYTVTGLTFSTDYTFTVKSKDKVGNLSKASTSETLTTKVLSPPTALAATKTTSSSTVLNWTAPADSTDVVGYNLYNGDELEYATTSTETNYTVTGLTSSTDYTFTVKSKDKAGNLSDASNDETITTKPSAPTNLQASTTTSSSTVLTWTAPEDAAVTGYNVYNSEEQVNDSAITDQTNYTVTGLTSSTDYTFTVKAIGNNGDLSAATDAVTVTTKRTAPTNLQASATTSSSTVLNWTAPTDVTDVVGYNVYNGDELEYATTSTETNYKVSGLTSSTSYTFTVKSKNKAGNLSEASNNATIQTTAVSPPINATTANTTSSKTVVKWSAPVDTTNVVGYNVYRISNNELIFVATSTNFKQIVNNLTPSTEYTFIVKSKDNAGNLSEATTPVTATTDSLNAPTELAAASTTSSSTVLDWTAPNDNAQDVVGYNVYNGDELEYATTGTETTYTVTGLTSSTDYTFTVKSKDKAGNLSEASTPETIRTKPSAPTNLQASTTTSSSTVLTWTASVDEAVTGYNVYNGDELEYATIGTETTYTVTELTSSTDYTFTVKATGIDGDLSAATDAVTVTTKTSAPTNLQASATTSSSTVLNWTAPEDAAVTGYNIYNNEVLLNDSAITDTNYAVAGLNSNTAYTFTVKAIGNEGSLSEATDGVTVTTVAVSAPTGLQASETTSSSTYLSWDDADVTGYNIYRVSNMPTNYVDNQAATTTNDLSYVGTTTATNYRVTDLTSSTDYTFIVKSKDEEDNLSAASNQETITTKPSAATNLRATETTTSSTVLDWDPSVDEAVTGYNVYNNEVQVNETPAETHYKVTGLISSSDYTFTVKAIGNDEDLSEATTGVTVTTGVLSAPTALTATATTSSSTVLSWSDSDDYENVVGYNVYRVSDMPANGFTNESDILVDTTTETTYTVTELTSSTDYTFIVKSKDEAGNLSAASDQETITTKPTAATNLKANETTSSSTVLSWTASTDEAVTGYNVYNNEVLVTDNPITTTSYTITALTSSTDYNFTVKAIGNDGDLSEASNRVTVTTKPTAATNLTASQTTSSSTFLYWTASTDEAVTGYNVYNNEVLVNDTAITDTNYAVAGLASSTEYSFTVKAIGNNGDSSAASNTKTITTRVLSPPADLQATDVTSSSTVLNWTAPQDVIDVVGYNVYRVSNMPSSSALYKSDYLVDTTTATTYTVTELASSTDYTFIVKSKDKAGNLSAASNITKITTKPRSTKGLTASQTTSSSTVLSWIASTDEAVTGYNVYNNEGLVNDSVITDTTYTVTGLTSSTDYTFTFKAIGKDGDLSEASDEVTITTGVLSPPANLEATDVTSSSTVLNWTDSDETNNVVGYNVYRVSNMQATGFDNESDYLVDTTIEKTYTITELTSSTDYTFIVKSKDEAGNLSAASNQQTITTKPSAATNLIASQTTSSSTVLSWDAPDDAAVTAYNVYNNEVLVNDSAIINTTYTVTGLTSSTDYTFTVKAIGNEEDLSAASNKAIITTGVLAAPDLQATDVTSSSAVLNWTDSDEFKNVVGYNVYRVSNMQATDGGNDQSPPTATINEPTYVGTTTAMTFTVTELTSSTDYTFIVKSKDEAGNLSEASNIAGITTKPSATTDLTASQTTSSSTVLDWNPSTDKAVTGYNVYNNEELVNDTAITDTTYTVTGLASSTDYTFTFRAIGNNGDLSAASDKATITTGVLSAPNLEATDVTSSSTVLNWTDSDEFENVVGYNVYRVSNMPATGFHNESGYLVDTTTATTYTVTELTSSTDYTFIVKSKDEAGNLSAASNQQTITTKPSAATNLTASQTTSSSTVLSWTKSTDEAVTGYNVYNNEVLFSTITDTTYTVSGLTSNTEFTFTVKAVGNNGHLSAASNIETITTKPNAPTALTATQTKSSSTVLSWTPPVGPAVMGYNVYNNEELVNNTAITAANYTVTELDYSTEYSFTVKAIGKNEGLSAASNIETVTTGALAPPAALKATGTASSSTVLSWTAPTDAKNVVGYSVYNGSNIVATVSATSYTVTGLSSSTDYTFTVKSKDASGNLSTASNAVTVTTGTVAATYCASKGETAADEYIKKVQLGAINNSSTGGNGYSDFTAVTTNLTIGTENTIIITPTWTGQTYPEAYAVWIDLNGNGDFEDDGELVWSKALSKTTPVSGSFTVPSSATTGSTRMRVSMSADGVPSACETFEYGEVEDYSVNIVEASTNTSPPTIPTNLTASGTTASSTSLSWTASTDDVAVTGYNIYNGSEMVASASGTSYTVTGLNSSTAYTFTVKAQDAAGNLSTASNEATVTTATLAAIYCASKGINDADEYIKKVQLGDINNSSTNGNGYSDFTAVTTNLTIGTENTITITPTWTGQTYSEAYAVWIDLNGDSDFEDAGELVWSKAPSKTTPVSGSFTVPNSATTGPTRMRVSMSADGVPSACETFTYGEVEDYSVNIVEASENKNPPTTPTNLIASGTTTSSTNLSWNASTDDEAVTGYNIYNGSEIVAAASGTSYTVTGLNSNTAYTFKVRAQDAAGNLSIASNTVNVTTGIVTPTYCSSKGKSAADEYIKNVKLGTINNTSTADNGYSDFTSITTNLTKGSVNTITITPTWTGTTYKEGYAVWIDLNGDLDFDDAGELVWSKAPSKTALVSGSFTVPSSATTGSTRMRVSMSAGGVPSACETFSYGEVEDYSIEIIDGNGNTNPPSKPTNLGASGTTTSSTNLSWNAPTDDEAVTAYYVYNGEEIITAVSGTSYTVTGLNSNTAYTFTVKAQDAAGNLSDASNAITITTETAIPTYCDSKGDIVSDEYIAKVQLGAINNPSTGGNGYSDFTSITTNITKGRNNTITITPTWTGTSYKEGYAVWIDLNGDLDFEDAGELVWSKAPSKTTPASGSFTIPSSATTGSTRMRISMKAEGIPSSCELFTYGEVEDYSVNIVEASENTNPPTAPTNLAASQTTTSSTNLSWTASTDDEAVTGYYVYNGEEIITAVSGTSYTVTGLNSNTAYTFTVQAQDAAGNLSTASNTVDVTTGTVAATYCASQGTDTNYEYIENVQLGDIDNSSTVGTGYSDFTASTTNLTIGAENTITITPTWTGQTYSEGYAVWIDLNGDSDFDDEGELVWSKAPSKAKQVFGSFIIPNSASTGVTRMRVSMQYNAIPFACGTYKYGEVEDYSVNIVNESNSNTKITKTTGKELGNKNSISSLQIYPNPTANVLNVSFEGNSKATYRIINFVGQQVGAGQLSESAINVSDLGIGIYILEVNDGEKITVKKFVKN